MQAGGWKLFVSAGLLSFFKKALTIRLYCSQGETACRENELRRRRGAPSSSSSLTYHENTVGFG